EDGLDADGVMIRGASVRASANSSASSSSFCFGQIYSDLLRFGQIRSDSPGGTHSAIRHGKSTTARDFPGFPGISRELARFKETFISPNLGRISLESRQISLHLA